MKSLFIVLPAAISNVGTVICLKKAKFSLTHGHPAMPWFIGVALTIVTAQYLMCWADVRGVSLGFVMSSIIVLVMLAAVLVEVHVPSGHLTLSNPAGLPALEQIGYGLAIGGIFLVGISKGLS